MCVSLIGNPAVLFQSKKSKDMPAHIFLVFDWNLILREEHGVDAKIDLVFFIEGALFFDVGNTKTDQEGTNITNGY